jgi:hypothetical protein
MRCLLAALSLVLAVPAARGQTPAPSSQAVRLERDREIALARTAAPPHVSQDASVLVLEGSRFVAAVEGTNGVTCWVSRTHPESLEPHCFDEEGARTILPLQVREVELRLAGESPEAVERVIALGLRDGTFRLPRRPAMSYMMSADQVLYSDDGRRVGAWKPHLMIYVPFVTAQDLGLAGPPQGSVMVFEGGTSTASVVIVVPEFARPAPEAASSR